MIKYLFQWNVPALQGNGLGRCFRRNMQHEGEEEKRSHSHNSQNFRGQGHKDPPSFDQSDFLHSFVAVLVDINFVTTEFKISQTIPGSNPTCFRFFLVQPYRVFLLYALVYVCILLRHYYQLSFIFDHHMHPRSFKPLDQSR